MNPHRSGIRRKYSSLFKYVFSHRGCEMQLDSASLSSLESEAQSTVDLLTGILELDLGLNKL